MEPRKSQEIQKIESKPCCPHIGIVKPRFQTAKIHTFNHKAGLDSENPIYEETADSFTSKISIIERNQILGFKCTVEEKMRLLDDGLIKNPG